MLTSRNFLYKEEMLMPARIQQVHELVPVMFIFSVLLFQAFSGKVLSSKLRNIVGLIVYQVIAGTQFFLFIFFTFLKERCIPRQELKGGTKPRSAKFTVSHGVVGGRSRGSSIFSEWFLAAVILDCIIYLWHQILPRI